MGSWLAALEGPSPEGIGRPHAFSSEALVILISTCLKEGPVELNWTVRAAWENSLGTWRHHLAQWPLCQLHSLPSSPNRIDPRRGRGAWPGSQPVAPRVL